MRKLKSRAAGLLLAAAMCASLLAVPASAAGTGVTAWNDTIGGKSAQVVGVEMRPGRTGVVHQRGVLQLLYQGRSSIPG